MYANPRNSLPPILLCDRRRRAVSKIFTGLSWAAAAWMAFMSLIVVGVIGV